MKYLVCKKQIDHDCDFEYIDAPDIESVIDQVVYPDGHEEESALEGENALDEILIIPAEHVVTVDVFEKTQALEKEKKRIKDAYQRKAEISELKRLQAKYGKEMAA